MKPEQVLTIDQDAQSVRDRLRSARQPRALILKLAPLHLPGRSGGVGAMRSRACIPVIASHLTI